jgi:hypothetical protein
LRLTFALILPFVHLDRRFNFCFDPLQGQGRLCTGYWTTISW